jgi:Zn-dependent protease with chaperone function
MENLIVYIAKACGLTTMFYLAYYMLLRKETFFRSNRLFLMLGLVTATVLPLIVFTKTVWITPQPLPPFEVLSAIPVNSIQSQPSMPIQEVTFQINWWYLAAVTYAMGAVFLLVRLIVDFKTVFSLFKGQNIIRQGQYKFIDSAAAKSPFSFFNYIIFNSAVLEPGELAGILSHEKVHSSQRHSIDMIAAQVFCAAFWFNPLAWLYKKSISQNLEFIADAEAVKHVDDVTAYQKTLLKITMQPANISITSHFYQSLIKKRIVMLNKPKSKKQNSWKYAVVLPALSAFMVAFQVEVVAQVKPAEASAIHTAGDFTDSVLITKYLDDAALAKHAESLSKAYGVSVTFGDVTRNKEGYITGLKAEVKGSSGGNAINKKYHLKGNNPIQSFLLTITKKGNEVEAAFTSENLENKDRVVLGSYDENTVPTIPEAYENLLVVIDGVKQPKGKGVGDINADDIKSMVIIKTPVEKYGADGKNGVIEITTKKEKYTAIPVTAQQAAMGTDNVLYVIDGVEQPKDGTAMKNIDPNTIESITVIKNDEAKRKYGEDGKDGVIIIATRSLDIFSEKPAPNPDSSVTTSVFTTTKTPDGASKTSWIVKGAVVVDTKKGDYEAYDFSLKNDGNSGFIISKTTSDTSLDFYTEILLKNGITLKYSGVERNSNGEIVKIKLELADGPAKASATFETSSGIANIYVGKKNGRLAVRAE